jgi:hypothetical protein
MFEVRGRYEIAAKACHRKSYMPESKNRAKKPAIEPF